MRQEDTIIIHSSTTSILFVILSVLYVIAVVLAITYILVILLRKKFTHHVIPDSQTNTVTTEDNNLTPPTKKKVNFNMASSKEPHMLSLKSQQHRNMKKISKNRDTVKKTSSLKISSKNTVPVVFPPSLSQILANSTLTHSVLTNTEDDSVLKTHPLLIVTEDSETYSAITMTENSLTNNTHSSTDRESSLPETHSSITMTDRESSLPETHSSITMTDRESSLPETHSLITMTDQETLSPETQSRTTIVGNKLPDTPVPMTNAGVSLQLPETPQGDFFETSSGNSRLSETPQEHSESLAVPHKAKILTGRFHETLPVLYPLKDQSHVIKSPNSKLIEENSTSAQSASKSKEDNKSIHRPVIIFSPHSHVTESKILPVLEERQTFIFNSVSSSSASIDDDYDYISSTPQSDYSHKFGILCD